MLISPSLVILSRARDGENGVVSAALAFGLAVGLAGSSIAGF
ncbi:hypothetical protein [Halopseudomonas maritima]|nr:hypothetical protein [Halopseudomonas maritima]